MLSVSHIFKFGIPVALVLSNLTWYVCYDNIRDKLVAERTAHEETIESYQKAQMEAEILNLKEARRIENENIKKAQEADATYAGLLRKYNASVLRYQAAQSTANTVYLSSTSESTDGVNQSREHTGILISLSDAGICAENTARLKAAHDWAMNQ